MKCLLRFSFLGAFIILIGVICPPKTVVNIKGYLNNKGSIDSLCFVLGFDYLKSAT
jgi:purine-cytosine permease-like protein